MIQLYNGDCMEILKTIADKSVDLVLIDPPYEHVNGGKGHGDLADRRDNVNRSIEFISNSFDMGGVFEELLRVCKLPNIMVFCSNRQISNIMSYFENKGYLATLLCWVKSNPIPTANNCYLSDIEYCVWVRGHGVRVNNDVPYDYKRKAYISSLVSIDRFHPAQKPDELIKRYLSVHSKEGDTVLDCFMGSGTTGVWCKKLNRDFIGIEIDKKYFDIAEKRINGAHKERRLF